MPSTGVPKQTPADGALTARWRRIGAGLILILGIGGILLGAFHPPHHVVVVGLGLFLAFAALVYFGLELLLHLAVRAVQQRPRKGDSTLPQEKPNPS